MTEPNRRARILPVAPDLTPEEAATVARFDAAEPAPESFDATAPLRRVVDALKLIDEYGCENLIRGRCSDPSSGRMRGARCTAEAWCHPCVAAAALAGDVL